MNKYELKKSSVCPRSLDPFYVASLTMKNVTRLLEQTVISPTQMVRSLDYSHARVWL